MIISVSDFIITPQSDGAVGDYGAGGVLNSETNQTNLSIYDISAEQATVINNDDASNHILEFTTTGSVKILPELSLFGITGQELQTINHASASDPIVEFTSSDKSSITPSMSIRNIQGQQQTSTTFADVTGLEFELTSHFEMESFDTDVRANSIRVQHGYGGLVKEAYGHEIQFVFGVDSSQISENSSRTTGYRLQHLYNEYYKRHTDQVEIQLVTDHESQLMSEFFSRIHAYRLQHAYKESFKVEDEFYEVLTVLPWSRESFDYDMQFITDFEVISDSDPRMYSLRVQHAYIGSYKVNDHFYEVLTVMPWSRESLDYDMQLVTPVTIVADTDARMKSLRIQHAYLANTNLYEVFHETLITIPWSREQEGYWYEFVADSDERPKHPDLLMSGAKVSMLLSEFEEVDTSDAYVELVAGFVIVKSMDQIFTESITSGNIPTILQGNFIEVISDTSRNLIYGNQEVTWFGTE